MGASREPGTLVTSSAGPGELSLDIETRVKDSAVWIAIRGEADLSNLAQLDRALSSVVLNGHQAVRVDLSDLSFIDVAALRRLTVFARQLRERGCDVATSDATPLLRRVVRLLSGQDALGLA